MKEEGKQAHGHFELLMHGGRRGTILVIWIDPVHKKFIGD